MRILLTSSRVEIHEKFILITCRKSISMSSVSDCSISSKLVVASIQRKRKSQNLFLLTVSLVVPNHLIGAILIRAEIRIHDL